MNPMNLMQMFQNPKHFMQNIMGNNQIMSNPMAKNAVELMQKGDAQGVEQMARNLCKEKGLNGDELRRFREIHDLPSNLNRIYLWTEKGAFLHAKSLNTDQAWEVYDRLVDNYFQKKDDKTNMPMSYRDAIAQLLESLDREAELQAQLDTSKDWYSIKRVAALNNVSWKTFKWRRLKEVGERMGHEVKKIFDANYGEVNAYHKDVWEAVYPDYEL